MGYHHLALAARDMKAIHDFYEGIMGFELVKVEIGPSPEGGWAKHFFYRMEDDSKFIAFWEMHDMPGTENFETNLSKAAGVPDHINHISFDVKDKAELDRRRQRWLDAGLDVLEIDERQFRGVLPDDRRLHEGRPRSRARRAQIRRAAAFEAAGEDRLPQAAGRLKHFFDRHCEERESATKQSRAASTGPAALDRHGCCAASR